nr:hypothetical protein [Nanoarchaeum sp.]
MEIKEFYEDFLILFHELYSHIDKDEFIEIRKKFDFIINKTLRYFRTNRFDQDNIYKMIKEASWIRDMIENKPKFNDKKNNQEMKDIITDINKFAVLIGSNLFDYTKKIEIQEQLLKECYNLFGNITYIRPEIREGYAYFGVLETDYDYYNDVHKKLINQLKKDYPDLSSSIVKFEKWIKNKNLQFAKEMGLVK